VVTCHWHCASSTTRAAMDFTALGLDARVARAASKRFALPTAVQAQAIPKVLAGKARTPRPLHARAHTRVSESSGRHTHRNLLSPFSLCVHILGCRCPSRHGFRQDAGVPPAVLAPPADQSAAEWQSRAAGIGAGAHSRTVPAGEPCCFFCQLFIGRGGLTSVVCLRCTAPYPPGP
jgi:hypothetical protein